MCVQHDCSDLRVIHDADEWAFYKVASGLPGKVERHMFLIENGRWVFVLLTSSFKSDCCVTDRASAPLTSGARHVGTK